MSGAMKTTVVERVGVLLNHFGKPKGNATSRPQPVAILSWLGNVLKIGTDMARMAYMARRKKSYF
jgi:hypothetical protein